MEGVEICPYGDTPSFLASLSSKTLCSSNSPAAVVTSLKSREVISDTPVSVLKAIKNKTEIEGMLLANVRSAACHCKLLKWAEDNADTGVTGLFKIFIINLQFARDRKTPIWPLLKEIEISETINSFSADFVWVLNKTRGEGGQVTLIRPRLYTG